MARQFKPFVYLNWRPDRLARASQKKSPAFPRDLPCSHLGPELAILIGILALARILLLLAGLLPAALLLTGLLARVLVLLAGLLTRVLGLLARVRILAAHSGSPWFEEV